MKRCPGGKYSIYQRLLDFDPWYVKVILGSFGTLTNLPKMACSKGYLSV